VSATRPSRQTSQRQGSPPQSRDVSQLRARRRQARRRRRLARLDLGLGVLGAIVLIVATPGLAISGLIALIVLAACAVSFILERRRRVRADREREPVRASRAEASAKRAQPGGRARDQRRSSP
jgi:Flp pilus assembly protein TadB